MREGYRKPTANGIPYESRCEYVRPWEGGTLGYAANAGRGKRGGISAGDGADSVERRGRRGEEGGGEGEGKVDGRRRGGGERKERATSLRGVRSGRVICEDAPAAVITWDLVALSLPREREDVM